MREAWCCGPGRDGRVWGTWGRGQRFSTWQQPARVKRSPESESIQQAFQGASLREALSVVSPCRRVDDGTRVLREGCWSCLDTAGQVVHSEAVFPAGEVPIGQV